MFFNCVVYSALVKILCSPIVSIAVSKGRISSKPCLEFFHLFITNALHFFKDCPFDTLCAWRSCQRPWITPVVLHVNWREEWCKHSIYKWEPKYWWDRFRFSKRITWWICKSLIDAHLMNKWIISVATSLSIKEDSNSCSHLTVCTLVLMYNLQFNIILSSIDRMLRRSPKLEL